MVIIGFGEAEITHTEDMLDFVLELFIRQAFASLKLKQEDYEKSAPGFTCHYNSAKGVGKANSIVIHAGDISLPLPQLKKLIRHVKDSFGHYDAIAGTNTEVYMPEIFR